MLLLPVFPALAVSWDGGYLEVPMRRHGVEIELSFVHSSELVPWKETWLADDSGIEASSVCYAGGGAGIPASPGDLGDATIELRGDMICASNLQRELGGRVEVAMGEMVEGRLIVDGVKVGGGGRVLLEVVDESLMGMMLRQLLQLGYGHGSLP